MAEIKLPPKELIFFAAVGGTVLPLLELANMLASRQNIFDPFFWGGAVVAVIIGVIALFVTQTRDIGGAISAGMMAPQLLNGIVSIAPVAGAFLLELVATPVYAQIDMVQMEKDSIGIMVVVESKNHVLELNAEQKTNFVKDTMHLKIHKDGKLSISGKNIDNFDVNFEEELNRIKNDSTGNKEYVVKVNVVEYVPQQQVQQNNKNKFLRGLFGGEKYRKKPQIHSKLEVSVEKVDTTKSDN